MRIRAAGLAMTLGISLAAGCSAKNTSTKPEGGAAASAADDVSAYQRKSQGTEAVLNVKKIYDGARTYYMEEHGGRDGQLGERSFPATVAMTPAAGSCCQAEGGKCAAAPEAWRHPSWDALMFSVDDPHKYTYEFVSSGTGAGAAFVARAVGDLDCDGVLSTFELRGKPDADGSVPRAGDVIRTNEQE